VAKLSLPRRLLKVVHPEGIPWVGTALYNVISTTSIFQRHYGLIARDILTYCSRGSVLDIGTGPGWLLVKLHQLSSGLRGTGIDASPSMVAKARKNIAKAGLSGTIEVLEGKASHIPFADGSFDAVVSTGSIHHWKDPSAGLNEAYRVLRNGCYALMYDVISDTPASVLGKVALEFGKLSTMLFWLHAFEEPFYSQKGFESLARSTFFEEGQTRFVGVLYCLILKKAGERNPVGAWPSSR